ncbi:unnamed protein product [Fraxinus pennsylvanica]|uniref:Ysc84 actin-binding domain-containing protein n=1 Tax=Fraxinus pennsylvanica TaxID=56036 RepID=A0AAD2A794_9LAMI|nr:unnamed protein product [Fraxinus pennsylvanica]
MRKHGWQLPYHPLQVVAVAVFLALGFAFYVFFAPFVESNCYSEISSIRVPENFYGVNKVMPTIHWEVGNIVVKRMDTNLQFYGDPYLTTADILLGTVDRPKAAEPLYAALRDLYCKLQC